jgi:quercetin dioxygenase-like cupin family protein
LLRIAAALRVEVDELLAAPEEPGPGTVVRGEASPFYEGEGFRFQPLIPEAGPEGLAAVKIVFPADRTEPEYKEHEGEEWIYVLSGRLRLTLGGESTVLEPGDAAYFNGLLPHRWDVLGEEDVEMLMAGCAASSGATAACFATHALVTEDVEAAELAAAPATQHELGRTS